MKKYDEDKLREDAAFINGRLTNFSEKIEVPSELSFENVRLNIFKISNAPPQVVKRKKRKLSLQFASFLLCIFVVVVAVILSRSDIFNPTEPIPNNINITPTPKNISGNPNTSSISADPPSSLPADNSATPSQYNLVGEEGFIELELSQNIAELSLAELYIDSSYIYYISEKAVKSTKIPFEDGDLSLSQAIEKGVITIEDLLHEGIVVYVKKI